jgi:lysophospholipase L1-like esterase
VLLGLGLFLGAGELLSALALRVVPEPQAEDETRLPPPEVWQARDENRPRDKAWHRYRIVCLGDSCTYGIGVKTQDSYPRQLERLLNEGLAYQRFEVLNLGIAGYTSYLGLLRLREMALAFRPDLVIASFGLNDKWRAELSDRAKTAWERSAAMTARHRVAAALEYSHLYRFLRRLLAPLVEARRTALSSLRISYRVPLVEYRQNLVSLARETREAGAEIIFLAMTETPAINRLTELGIAAYEQADYRQASAKLERVAGIKFMYYPRPLHYLSLAYAALGERSLAARARRRAEQFAKIFPYPHSLRGALDRVEVLDHLEGDTLRPQDHFDVFALYRQVMAEVAEVEHVPLVDLAAQGLGESDFFDYCHLVGSGYGKLAQAVADVIRHKVLPRQPGGPGQPANP